MKTTTKIAIWSLAALLAAGFTACKKDDIKIIGPHITLTTTKNPGENIVLCIACYDKYDKLDVWIDLNNNGIEDSGEANIKFSNDKEYPLGAQTITIYGKVIELRCNENRLKVLDVSKNPSLQYLHCYGNQLTSLNVSNNTELMGLVCSDNLLSTLDVSKNTNLGELLCFNNQLKTLDVSKNTNLTRLSCSGNQLSALNVSNNEKLKVLICHNNTIFGTKMNELVNGLPRRKVTDNASFYVINKNEDGNMCTEDQVSTAIHKNWKVLNSNGQPYTGS